MTRLPVVSSDSNAWGTVLNAFLGVAHNADGSLKAFVNAKDSTYGAVGDGSNDDTAAITAAITAANGGPVILPKGIYKISSALALSIANTKILGAGAGATILQPSAGFSGSNIVNITANYCGLRDLSIQYANTSYASNPSADGIQITAAQNILLQNLSINYINGWAAQSSSSNSVRNKWSKFDNIFSTLCAKGAHIVGTASNPNAAHVLTDCIFDQVATGSSNGDGILIEDTFDTELSNIECNVSAGSGAAFHVKGNVASLHMVNFVGGNDTPTSTGSALLIETGANGDPKQINMANCIFEDGNVGASITSCTQSNFTDCDFLGNATHGVDITSPCDALTFKGCNFNGNGATAGANHFDFQTATFGNIIVLGCSFLTPQGSGSGQTTAAVNDLSSHSFYAYNNFLNSAFNNLTGTARDNNGFNPLGSRTPPAMPATTVAIQNTFGFDCMVYIVGGTVSAIAVGNGSGSTVATGLTNSAAGVSVLLKAKQWIKLTYTGAPTWTWFGL